MALVRAERLQSLRRVDSRAQREIFSARAFALVRTHPRAGVTRLRLASVRRAAHPRDGHLYPVSEREPDRARWFIDEVHAHDSSLRAYLRGSFPLVRDVDDVVQESYVRVWKARPAEPIRSARAFLFRVARHLALDWLRRDRSSPIDGVTDLADLRVLDNGPGVAESACVQEETALLLAAIDALPPRCREIVILRKLRGLPQKEIAARLGLSEQTVQVQIGRGVRKCEEFLRRRGVQR